MRILFFGDSITQGFWDLKGGWVNRLRKYYDLQNIKGINKNSPLIFNLGISGDTSDNIIARFENEVNVRKRPDEEIAIVLSVGISDSCIDSGTNIMSTEQYTENLSKLLELAHKHANKVIFVGLTPCVDDRTNPVHWNKNTAYSYDRVKSFNDELRNFCTENNVNFIDILKVMTEKQTEIELLPDGVHPNSEGHKFMAE